MKNNTILSFVGLFLLCMVPGALAVDFYTGRIIIDHEDAKKLCPKICESHGRGWSGNWATNYSYGSVCGCRGTEAEKRAEHQKCLEKEGHSMMAAISCQKYLK